VDLRKALLHKLRHDIESLRHGIEWMEAGILKTGDADNGWVRYRTEEIEREAV
jgi:hypothetical protein